MAHSELLNVVSIESLTDALAGVEPRKSDVCPLSPKLLHLNASTALRTILIALGFVCLCS